MFITMPSLVHPPHAKDKVEVMLRGNCALPGRVSAGSKGITQNPISELLPLPVFRGRGLQVKNFQCVRFEIQLDGNQSCLE